MGVEIICGDALAELRKLRDESVDCVLTDPPYGQTSLQWDKWVSEWPAECARVLKPSGSMWVFGSMRMFLDHIGEFSDFKMSHDIVWEKQNGTGLFNDRFRRVHEHALHFYPKRSKWRDVYKSAQFTMDAKARTVRKKGRPAHWIGATGETTYVSEDGGPRLMRSVLQVRNLHGSAEHPTQKPLELVEPMLKYACPPGGTVLDPFAGSGTTGVTAALLGMNAVLIEGQRTYAALAAERILLEGGT